MNDLYVLRYLNNINIKEVLGFAKDNDEKYIFQGKNENNEFVNGTVNFNHNNVNIVYQTENAQIHMHTSTITYYGNGEYAVKTEHILVKNGKSVLLESKYGENIPKQDIFNFKEKTKKENDNFVYTYQRKFSY